MSVNGWISRILLLLLGKSNNHHINHNISNLNKNIKVEPDKVSNMIWLIWMNGEGAANPSWVPSWTKGGRWSWATWPSRGRRLPWTRDRFRSRPPSHTTTRDNLDATPIRSAIFASVEWLDAYAEYILVQCRNCTYWLLYLLRTEPSYKSLFHAFAIFR